MPNRHDGWSGGRVSRDALTTRLGPAIAARVETGPSIEKWIAPLRSFIVEPTRFGSLLPVEYVAHIVPPAGAKGLNLAVSDVHYLTRTLIEHFCDGSSAGLERYSDAALRRVWASTRFA